MLFYTSWFELLNMSLIGCLLGQKVPLFAMSKKSTIFLIHPNFGILSHKLAQICINMLIHGAFLLHLVPGCSSILAKNKSSIYGMKGRQL